MKLSKEIVNGQHESIRRHVLNVRHQVYMPFGASLTVSCPSASYHHSPSLVVRRKELERTFQERGRTAIPRSWLSYTQMHRCATSLPSQLIACGRISQLLRALTITTTT